MIANVQLAVAQNCAARLTAFGCTKKENLTAVDFTRAAICDQGGIVSCAVEEHCCSAACALDCASVVRDSGIARRSVGTTKCNLSTLRALGQRSVVNESAVTCARVSKLHHRFLDGSGNTGVVDKGGITCSRIHCEYSPAPRRAFNGAAVPGNNSVGRRGAI